MFRPLYASAVEDFLESPVFPALVLAFLIVAAVAGLGGYVSAQKNRPWAEGALLSLFLGPFGLLIAALLPTRPRRRKEPVKGPKDWPDFD